MKCYIVIFFIGVCMLFVCSCELETSNNGDLDGMWHLVRVDTLSTSGVKYMEDDKIYWLFQFKLLQLEDKSGNKVSLLMRFEHKDNILRLYDPYIYDRTNGDKPLTDISLSAPYGVNSLEENFSIESLENGKMVLCTESLRLYFRKL